MTVVRCEYISKVYKLYDSPVSRLKEALHPFRKRYHQEFYALRDVCFNVEKGELFGIIGKNGSGKSTLLKIITNVLTPTGGSVKVHGKISALLELGAGFNPEFTGLENVYFHSSIMGYAKPEIDQHLEQILAFADIGEFIHQPVKTYSSGMLVRLAFAVASNIEPDVLIVDEALAVGDEAFQRKCFSKIQAIQERGASIIFVSHSAGTIVELCHRAMLLDQGELLLMGPPKIVISKYHQLLYAQDERRYTLRQEIRQLYGQQACPEIHDGPKGSQYQGETTSSPPEPVLKEWYDPNLRPQQTGVYSENNDYGVSISDVKLTMLDGKQVNHLVMGRSYLYHYQVTFRKTAFRIRFGMLIKTISGLELGGSTSSTQADAIPCVEPETIMQVQFRFRCALHPGTYFMNAGVVGMIDEEETFLDRLVDVLMFRVLPDYGLHETGIVSFSVKSTWFLQT